jgi:hypothetical protein
MTKRRSTRSTGGIVGLLIVIVIGVVFFLLRSNPAMMENLPPDLQTAVQGVGGTSAPVAQPGATQSGGQPAGGGQTLPELPDASFKQPFGEITFKGCPPEGDGGDPDLNMRKNRVDDGNYQPVAFQTMMSLTWPKEIERKDHKNWSAADSAAIDQYEELPVVVEGYLLDAVQSGEESTNCHSTEDNDFHIWMLDHAGSKDDRAGSLVIETTPRVRQNHPKWTVGNLNDLARNGTKVRISGWTFFDPEHPDQIGKTRGTIWEIHPVMKLEFELNGAWVNLDDLSN